MRSAVILATLLLLSCIPFTTNADGLQSSGINIEVTHDSLNEMATITITAPETDNSSLLDDLKNTELVIIRTHQTDAPEIIEIVATGVKICELADLNSECSGSSITLSHYPIPSNYSYYDYWIVDQPNFENGLYNIMQWI